MKELIQKHSAEVAIVIYDAPLPPKYFKFSKKFIRTLFLVFPLLIIFSLVAMFAWGLGLRLQQSQVPSFPVLISEDDKKIESLENEISALRDSNLKMAEKLAATTGAGTAAVSEKPFLLNIKEPYGMQNLTTQKKVTLQQFEFSQLGNGSVLKFQILSSIQEVKVSGHIIVYMVSASGIQAYPKELNSNPADGVKFSAGEQFSVSKLRPTLATFEVMPAGPTVKFIIYIFSRDGDLLLRQETDSFKTGAKS